MMFLSSLSLQLFWVFSIYLEALAIVPQLIILQRYREVENLTAHYVFLLGIYRALYIVNWVYRSYHELYYKHNWVVYICGFVQTCLYIDFFYYYFLRYVGCTAGCVLFMPVSKCCICHLFPYTASTKVASLLCPTKLVKCTRDAD